MKSKSQQIQGRQEFEGHYSEPGHELYFNSDPKVCQFLKSIYLEQIQKDQQKIDELIQSIQKRLKDIAMIDNEGRCIMQRIIPKERIAFNKWKDDKFGTGSKGT